MSGGFIQIHDTEINIDNITLPSGLATSDKQDISNSLLTSIDSTLASGLNVSGTGSSINLTDTNKLIATGNDVVSLIDTSIGHKDDFEAGSDTGTWSLIALFKRLLTKIDSLGFGNTLDSGFELDMLTDLATATNQTYQIQNEVSGINILTSIDTKLDNLNTTVNFPSGLATSDKQDILNDTLITVYDRLNEILQVEVINFPSGSNEVSCCSGLTNSELRASAIDVNVLNNISVSGLATESKQDVIIQNILDLNSDLGNDNDNIASSDTGTFSLISLFKRLLEKLSIGISVVVSNFPTIQTVSVSGIVNVTGTVAVNNFPTFTGLTNTQLRATPVDVNIASASGASGLATAAKQDTGNVLLNSIDIKVATSAKQDSQTTLLTNISNYTNFLDVFLSTRASIAKQDIGNTSLASIDAKTVATATSGLQVTGNASLSSIDSKLTPPLTVQYDGYILDNLGKLRVSQLNSLGDYKILNSFFDTKLLEQAGTATFTVNSNNVLMSVTSGQYGIIQSKFHHPYFNGKSQIIQFTVTNFGNATNVEKSVGYYNSAATGVFSTGLDGIRLYKDITNVYSIQIWRNGTQLTTTSLLRANWIDKLDGTGSSGMTINFDNFNIFTFDFLYLGGSTLRCFVHYQGKNILFAQFHYSNTDTQPFLNSPNKPIRYEIRSSTGSGSLNFICSTVGSEATLTDLGFTTSIKGDIAGINPTLLGIKYALVGVRKATTYRDVYAFVESFQGAISTANDFVDLEILLNPTVAGVFVYTAVTGTPFEMATGSILSLVTGGFSIQNIYVSNGNSNVQNVSSILTRLSSTLNNTMDTIVLCASPALNTNNIRVTGSLKLKWMN